MSHGQIAKIAATKFGAGDWWSQMVTVGSRRACRARSRRRPRS
jgi:hypothetical protein